jgi:mono/diheme cytochrome c family protein
MILIVFLTVYHKRGLLMRFSFGWFLGLWIIGSACVPEDLAIPAEPIGTIPQWGEGFTAKAQAQERESLLAMKNVMGGAKAFQEAKDISKIKKTANKAADAQLFKKHCARCHGAQGNGGQRMGIGQIPSLKSPAIKKMSHEQLQGIIMNGKGRMPAMKTVVPAEDLPALVRFIHSLNPS